MPKQRSRSAWPLAFVLAGCAATSPAPLAPTAALAPEPAAALHVRLTFGPEADLDLYVTDPRSETVYFGNNPSLGGGRLEQDLRCTAAAPRSEVVSFATPRPGAYRVGVRHAAACERGHETVAYRVEAYAGVRRWERTGTLAAGSFDNRVLEFEWRPDEPAPGARPDASADVTPPSSAHEDPNR